MQFIIRKFVFAAVFVSAAAAFAQDRVGVNVPFSFETHGKIFPAGTYEVKFDEKLHALKLSSRIDTKMTYMSQTFVTDFGPDMSELSLRFDHGADGTRVLRSTRLENWTTPVVDKRDRYVVQQTPGQ
jgi:hypothetical protein